MKNKSIFLTAILLFFGIASFAQAGKDENFTGDMKKEMCNKVKLAAQHAWQG